MLSANAYLGSAPIVEALAKGANVVITGRSTDTALTMAPLRHEFGWGDSDWDRLAAGIVAGHIIECGAQSSGGNRLRDWRSVPDLANVGYPIVEASADGTFIVTKHAGTGGIVDVPGITEQLVYEMGDPHAYITPDVIADFATIQLADAGKDRVRVSGIKGRPATEFLKVSIAYRAGYKAVGTLVYAWPDALEKAQLAGRVLRERLDTLGLKFDEVRVEFVGASATHGALAGTAARSSGGAAPRRRARRRSQDGRAIHARDRAARAQRPAQCHGLRGRPAEGGGRRRLLAGAREQERRHDERHGGRMRVRLLDIAHARSGDKGDTANVGLIALRAEWYPVLVEHVTAARVTQHYGAEITGPVERFELPNLIALNFLLHGALGGGGTVSLKTDAQGKVFSTSLLRLVIDVPDADREETRPSRGARMTRVRTATAAGVARITLARADKRNALDQAMVAGAARCGESRGRRCGGARAAH